MSTIVLVAVSANAALALGLYLMLRPAADDPQEQGGPARRQGEEDSMALRRRKPR
jgi:hypothetical protein